MQAFTFQPMAGANGEFTGVKLIAAYHKAKGRKRRKMLIPDAAHGTNPASAALAGFEAVNIESRDGMVDPDALIAAIAEHGEDVAGLMMTCPNTLGLMEVHLPRIVEELRKIDALLYYDGANMNAIMGKMRVGDVGFDVVHLNVHKTLGTPHGGGGRAPGPVGVNERLLPFLPAPRVALREDGSFYLDYNLPQSIGYIGPFYGSFGVLIKALAYMLRLGGEGLERASEYAALNANYLKKRLEKTLDIPYADRLCAHEFVASAPEGLARPGYRQGSSGSRLPRAHHLLPADCPGMSDGRAHRNREQRNSGRLHSGPGRNRGPGQERSPTSCRGSHQPARAPPGRNRGRATHGADRGYGAGRVNATTLSVVCRRVNGVLARDAALAGYVLVQRLPGSAHSPDALRMSGICIGISRSLRVART